MAKRNAGSELNHDNWDEEEETEEAGEFKKASDDQMKARVVKKAKRRNLTEDQKKNVFAGFGGFTSSNKSAEEAFSFLGKPKEATEETDAKTKAAFSGFAFGGQEKKNGDSKDAFSGFSFGAEKKNGDSKPSEEAKEEAPKSDDLMAKFMTKSGGNWSCSVCMISNSSDKPKCAACETPKPSEAKPCETPVAPESDDLMAKCMAKSAASWSCGVCMISNSADKAKCAACETPNPKAAPAKSNDMMAKFMTKSGGNWSCSVCMISNAADKAKCAACETPKPGGEKPETSELAKPTFNFGSGGGFKFVDANAGSAKTETAFSSFKFGGSEPEAASASNGGGFKFGASEPAATPSTEGGFKFGASASSPPAVAPASGFSFGSGGIVATPGKGGFTFSSTQKVSEGPVTDTPSKGRPGRKEYLTGLKALNTQVTNWIKSHVDENPLVDLSPVFKDYQKHILQLREKYDVKAVEVKVSTEAKEEADRVKAGTEDKEEETDKVKPFSFGGASTEEEKKPFSFGIKQSDTDLKPFGTVSSNFGSSTGASGFSFGFLNQAKEESSTKIIHKISPFEPCSQEEEEEAPKAEKVEPVAEEDSLYSKKCKLFYKKEDAYTERGLGTVHLKLTEDKRVQVVVRAETSLGNILLNVLVSEGVPVERVGKNNVMLICVPNPPIDPKAEPEPVTFLLRVKTGEEADELREKMLGLGKEGEGKD